jgi:hypothetical protein
MENDSTKILNEKDFLSNEIKVLLKEDKPKSEEKKDLDKENTFLSDGLSYWAKHDPKFINSYEKGEIISNYNSVSEYDHLNLFHSITRVFYELIREELIKKEIDTSNIKDCFYIIDTSFKVLSKQIESELSSLEKDLEKPVERVNIDLLFSGLHGFLNSYVQRKKEQ